MPIGLATGYKSASQRARVVTEGWAAEQLYCPACSGNEIDATPPNTRAIDFVCGQCAQSYQLKGKSSRWGNKVVDGAYDTLMEALRSDRVPNLLLLQYDPHRWKVVTLVLVPAFAFSPSAIECRKPLRPTARRAGWVGCFIILSRIPVEARIRMIFDGRPIPRATVRAQFRRLLPLKELTLPKRGWTLDVLNVVGSLGKASFTNADIYARCEELQGLHPENRHVKAKIRQQLQFLRNAGFLADEGRGRWRLC